MKKKIIGFLAGILIAGGGTAQAIDNETLFGLAAATIAGIAIFNENDQGKQTQNTQTKKSTYKKKRKAVVITDEMKIQSALQELGFYKGKINGDINSFETRSAIKKMNIEYARSNTSSLSSINKNNLIYLSDLQKFDKYLNITKKTKKTKNKRFQAALTVHGAYLGKIDGDLGKNTRSAITQYKRDKSLSANSKLTPDEKYELISSAIEKNTQDIITLTSSMKVISEIKTLPVTEKSHIALAPVATTVISENKDIVVKKDLQKTITVKKETAGNNSSKETSNVDTKKNKIASSEIKANEVKENLSIATKDDLKTTITTEVDEKKEVTWKSAYKETDNIEKKDNKLIENLQSEDELKTIDVKTATSWKDAYKI